MSNFTPAVPLRVVAYTDAAGVGGAEISLGHLVAAVGAVVEITVVGEDADVLGAIAARHPQARSQLVNHNFFAHRRLFQRLRPQVIHCNLCTPWAGAIGLAAALSLPDVRVVRVDQLPLRTTDAVQLWRTRALSLRVDAHVAVGQASARRMEDFYALGRHSVLSIPNGVPDSIAPSPIAPSDQMLVVGSVGRLDRMKAHDVLIRSIAQVKNLRAVIVGEGSERSALAQMAIDLGVGDRVELRGWSDDPRSLLAEFDIVALPSRSEGFPLAIVEAMLAARPVVATRVGSVPEAVTDGKTGLLIEKDDVDSLAAALQQLVDRPDLRLHMGNTARQIAQTHFTSDRMAASYLNLWQTVCNRSPAPRLHIPRPRD